ncbi:hypothetical protein MPTK1_2g05870 [Marchantia polymorpha subsp. ruderalis]|uniref:DUF7725 domain-containing protein n=1 Tax=Marchantia polymorpha TaxID=3197 RepID=A0A2R6XDM8_MARPO|nr:hypothetical protein MARPO_0021s0043 [Marchantia polymorpha]PTQ44169.1 hypothetical protein MARPO_0021s0043 [Marchantia polymorpha]BBN01242.1 hypothetical protein Mp_2g05870 [Marchantia polymorpha subsp. ruderalis]BBN01243.1 hypothetical protein Mp_2g05870 [Marchantia polymorpha subsp. ruderalis]|eukprot:PTQ44168.1 hypothetical protein MARPO_0021s0043 [Marchantia polymorpha]
MEASVAVGGHGAGLPLQSQVGRKEWRVVTESNGRERIIPADGSGNQTRVNAAGRPRSNSGASRRSSRNGQMFHAASSGHSSDSDHHGGEVGGAHMMGGSVPPQELLPQNIGQGDEAVLYEEMHRPQQRNEHLETQMSSMSMDPGMNTLESPDESFQQRLHEVSRERERLQQAEVEMRAQYIARSEVVRMQNGLDEQAKQHAEIVNNLQGQVQEMEQQIRHLEQQLEEREREFHVNQMETNEAVWQKDGLLREQTNELATLRRERDSAVSEHKAAASQFDAERAELMTQLETMKEQIREKDRLLQEAEEQNRNSQELILYKDEQMRDAQAWMSRATDMDAYYVNTNNSLHNELRERTEQMNNLWVGYQRQLADVERYHAQMIQRLQQELTDVREQNRVLMGAAAPERSESKDQRPFTESKDVGRVDVNDEKGTKISLSNNNTANRIKSNIADSGTVIANGTMEELMPVLFPRDVPLKVEHPTGIPVVPATLLGITPVLPPSGQIAAIHQFGMHQQGMPPALQATPVPLPQASLAQLQPITALLAPQQHLPPLQHQQAVHYHHHPQQHQSPIHRLSQRPQQQPLQQLQPAAPSQSPHSQQPSPLSSQAQQPRVQEHQHKQQEQVNLEQAVTQGDEQSVPLAQPSSLPPQQHSHNQTAQQLNSQLLHQSQSTMTNASNGSEKIESSPKSQQTRQDEQLVLPDDGQQKQSGEELQKPELAAQHRQQNNQQDRQNHDQRRRMDTRLQHYTHQQGKHVQSQSHRIFPQENMMTPQLQHQQGISSSMDHLGGGTHSSSVSQEGTEHGQIEGVAKKSLSEKQEHNNSEHQLVKQQNHVESSVKVVEPALLDERSLLACLVRAVPAEPSARIRISSTLPNRLGKMLAPLHWHDYRKQFGRLDEFVGAHPELFVIEDDLIHLREGAHATFSATTAVAKAAAAAAAVTPPGPPTRMPNVAVTPVAQTQLPRARSLKGVNNPQKDKKATSVPSQDAVSHSSSTSQSTNSRQNQGAASSRTAVANGGNVGQHHIGGTASTNNGNKGESGGRSSGAPSNHGNDNSATYENGGYSSARTNGYYGSRQQGRGSFSNSGQYRKQENHARPHTQEGRIMGSAPTVSQ